MAQLEVRLLGPIEVEAGPSLVDMARPLERALLARLALEPAHAVSSERLVDDLWGEELPQNPVASLQGLVYRLRRTLDGSGVVVAHRNAGYALDVPPESVDAARFEQLIRQARNHVQSAHTDGLELLRAALDLWRGEPLAGIDGFPFVAAQRTRLTSARLGAIGDRVDAELRQGQHVRLVGELQGLVAEHPHQERFWAQLMLALYRCGAQADALQRFQELRSRLAEELGIPPGPAVTQLERAILAQDPGLDWHPGRSQAMSVCPSPTQSGQTPAWSPRGAGRFVGRATELASAWAARERAGTERALLLVTGEPGIGKTRFAAELAARADGAGDLVLHGRWDEDILCPYQAFREALAELATSADPALPPGRGAELARVIPEVGDAAEVPGPAGSSPDADRHRIFDAVDAWVSALAERNRVVLVLDDLQWADPPSLRLLEFLLRSKRRAPFLVVAACRQTEPDTGGWLAQSLAGLRRSTAVELVPLHGLSGAEAEDLLGSALGYILSEPESAGARNLRSHTGGNPFFLQAIAQDLLEGGGSLEAWSDADGEALPVPGQLRDVVYWRLREVSAKCMEVLSAASALGEVFSAAVIGDALGCDEETLLSALDEARVAGIIDTERSGEDSHRFAHAVVRHALYDDMSPSRRIRLHHRLATVLEGRPAAGSQARLAELARHFYLGASSAGADKALEYSREAADEALRQLAYETAHEHLGRALEVASTHFPDDAPLRSELLVALGHARLKAGLLQDANEVFSDAFEEAGRCGRKDLAVEAALGYGGVLPAGCEPDARARAMLTTVLDDLGNGDDPARSLALGRLAHWTHFVTPREQRRDWADESVTIARRIGDPTTLAAALVHTFWALDGPEDCEDRLTLSSEIQELGSTLEDPEIVLQGLKCELHARLELGDFSECTNVAEQVAKLATATRQPEYLRLISMWDSLVAGIQGRYDDAEARARDALDILGRAGHPQEHGVHFAIVLPWRWLQGRMHELRLLLELSKTGRNSPAEVAALAWVASELGEDGLARGLVASLPIGHVLASERNFYWWFLAVGLARTAVNLGEVELASTLYDTLLPFGDQNCRAGQATFLGAAALHIGALASVLEQPDAAVSHYEAALARHRSMQATPLEVLTLTELAAVLDHRGRSEDRSRARRLRSDAAGRAAGLDIPRALAAAR